MGSPPHMRGKETKFLSGGMAERITPAYAGKVANSGGGRVLCGITPAYAGKSKLSPNCIVVKRDHPRICGEKSQHIGARYIPKGSPPHMRGKVLSFVFRLNRDGITPAYAGKSHYPVLIPEERRDHPRICGEKSSPSSRPSCSAGSPPHMRGKETKFLSGGMAERITPAYAGKVANSGGGRVLCGITPAYAGKSKLSPNCIVVKRDHPRICGEKSQHIGARYIPKGSPPHMRGKVLSFVFRLNRDGITPAYAGKSHYPVLIPEERRDHPRICGEKSSPSSRPSCSAGSPPHMRGKVIKCGFGWCAERITPAYAGKSYRVRSDLMYQWDHPRICGEKTKKIP